MEKLSTNSSPNVTIADPPFFDKYPKVHIFLSFALIIHRIEFFYL